MSKAKLKYILEEVSQKLYDKEGRRSDRQVVDQKLRKEGSNMSNHTLSINSELLFQETLYEITYRLDDIVNVEQEAIIRREVERFCAKVYSNFKLLKATTVVSVRKVGTPKNFALIFTRKSGKPRVFDQAVRGSLNPFRKELEARLQDALGNWKRGKRPELFQLGHSEGYSIAEQGPSLLLDTGQKEFVKKTQTHDVILQMEKFGLLDTKKNFVRISLESTQRNEDTSAKEKEAGLALLKKDLRAYIDTLDISKISGSPNMQEEIVAALIAASRGRDYKKKINSKASKTIKQKTTSTRSKLDLKVKVKKAPPRNWLSLVAAINAKLPAVVRSNMGAPGLVNRTGRFSESVKISSVTQTAQGFPSFGTTYDKTPYGVFDRTLGASPWATPDRDPQTLIHKSLRQILQEMAIGRFYLRRE